MNAQDDKPARPVFWCGVLNGEARPAASGTAVRTIRGAYTASRAPDAKRAGDTPKPPTWPERA